MKSDHCTARSKRKKSQEKIRGPLNKIFQIHQGVHRLFVLISLFFGLCQFGNAAYPLIYEKLVVCLFSAMGGFLITYLSLRAVAACIVWLVDGFRKAER